MSMDRRQFLKGVLAGGAVAATAAPAPAEARGNLTMPPKAMGLLYDGTLCIGCKACVSACKESNGLPPEFSTEDHMWDTPLDISGKTKNIIKMYKDGTGEVKDREKDGYAFMKHSCLHCVDPSCVSACPVSAMRKNPETGVVTYDPHDCIGCRYCVLACPFDVPRFQYDKAFPQIVKCELCSHLASPDNHTRFEYSACAQVCPTGATIFGPTDELMAEAKRRLALKPGTDYMVPRGKLGGGDWQMAKAANYVPQVYGEKELGGTQVLKLSAVPFDKLGYRDLPERSFASISETMQHSLYGYLIAPVVVLGGLVVAAKHSLRDQDEDQE
ncbi:hydrogenase 2 operon protein HybA [Parasulfuritortus cantonensis]|nr:hydrogenase 2 operon protein HybA [Parasulfuritortus cantonensis]